MKLDKKETKKFGLKVLRSDKTEEKQPQSQNKKKKQDLAQDSEADSLQRRDEE